MIGLLVPLRQDGRKVLMNTINSIAKFVNKYLIYLMVLLMLISYLFPQPFLWIPTRTTTLLSIIMFCMGMTLNVTAFKMVVIQPKAFILGLLIQFTISPLVAYGLAQLFGLSSGLIIGFVLLGSVSGGTASNVMTFIGKGDVALTVSLTTVSTLMATVVTPFLVYFLAGQYTEISFFAMLLSVLQMVLLPILLGIIVHKLIANYIDAWMQAFVLVSSVSILLIVAGTVAKNGAVIVQSGIIVIFVVLLHNLIGYGAGYGISRLLGVSDQQAKSIMFQLGMKNTGLAISLANAHFATIAAAVTPAAVGMIIHQITGPILANIVAKKEGKQYESKYLLPNYTIGTDAYEKVNDIVKSYGTKAVLIGGKTALAKAEHKIKSALTQDVFVIDSLWYGGNSTYENVARLLQEESVQAAEVLFAVGGGRVCDTVKVVGEKLAKPVFTFPTIGSNCSPVTAVCVIYTEAGEMQGLFFPSKPPVHAFY